jgi:hypothetical protein
VHLDRLFEKVPDDLNNSELGDALNDDGPPEPWMVDAQKLAPAFQAMDVLVESSGLAMESWGLQDEVPPFLDIMAVSRSRLINAWRYAEQDRSDEALAEMMRTARLGLLLEHGGGSLLSSMVGLAIGDEALTQMLVLVSWESPPGPAMLTALAQELEAASALPSGLEASVLGECRGAEALYDEMRWWSHEQLFATTDMTAPQPPPIEVVPGGRECCWPVYDADRTIAMARRRCRVAAGMANVPGSQRTAPRHRSLTAESLLSPGAYLDNPIGRILLDVSTPGYASFFDREDQLRSRRALALAWLGVLRRRQAEPDGELPATLEELVPAYLGAVPVDPWDGQPVSWDPAEGKLWVGRSEGEFGDMGLVLGLDL